MSLTKEQIAAAWEGIPEAFWPTLDKPWRVAWGFGAFKDFATEAEAQSFRDKMYADDVRDGGGWERLVRDPFNVHDLTTEKVPG